MHWTLDETKGFMKLISEHPALYNPTHIKYKDKPHKDSIWDGIAQALNRSSESCKNHWQSLNETFKRKYKGKIKIDRKSNCYMYQLMSLIEDIVEEETLFTKLEDNVDLPIERAKFANQQIPEFSLEPLNEFTEFDELEPSPDIHNLVRENSSNVKTKTIYSIPLEDKTDPLSTPSTSDTKTEIKSLIIEIEPEVDSILPDTNVSKDIINKAKTVQYTGDSMPSILKRRQRLEKQHSSNVSSVNTNGDIRGVKETAYGENKSIQCFVQYAMEVLNKLPPDLRIQAKQDMFRIVTKYEQMALQKNHSHNLSNSRDESVPHQAKRIKKEPVN